jgi:hypothetical protein
MAVNASSSGRAAAWPCRAAAALVHALIPAHRRLARASMSEPPRWGRPRRHAVRTAARLTHRRRAGAPKAGSLAARVDCQWQALGPHPRGEHGAALLPEHGRTGDHVGRAAAVRGVPVDLGAAGGAPPERQGAGLAPRFQQLARAAADAARRRLGAHAEPPVRLAWRPLVVAASQGCTRSLRPVQRSSAVHSFVHMQHHKYRH